MPQATAGLAVDYSGTGGVAGYYDGAQGLGGYVLPGQVVAPGLRSLAVGSIVGGSAGVTGLAYTGVNAARAAAAGWAGLGGARQELLLRTFARLLAKAADIETHGQIPKSVESLPVPRTYYGQKR